MIILDTNVFSALIRSNPNLAVIEWLDTLNPELIYTTSISVYEILYGINLLPKGKKKKQLFDAFQLMLSEHFYAKTLFFDKNAAYSSGIIAADLKAKGYNVGTHDLQIAGIAESRDAIIATRNEKDFPMNAVIDPWNIN